MNFSDIADRLKQFPVAVGCAGVLLLLVVVVFLRGGVASELSMRESELSSRIRTIETNIKNSKGLKQHLEKLNSMVDEVKALLFKRHERAVNVNFFYDLEDKAEVTIVRITQLPDPDPIYAKGGARALDLHSTLVYSINVNGSFSDVLNFLQKIEQVDHLMRVADFQMSRKVSELGEASIDARLRVLVLARKS